MTRRRYEVLLGCAAGLAVLGWLALVLSFWLPGAAGQALNSTAVAMLAPGVVGAVGLGAWGWATEDPFGERAGGPTLRCTDCGTKVLGPSGVTIGDRLEQELMP